MVPTTQSADLRAYYSKHAKNDHLESKMLARLPLLHPEGLHEHTGHRPADPLRRLVKMRASIIKRRTAVYQRLDAQLELLGPAWYDALATRYGDMFPAHPRAREHQPATKRDQPHFEVLVVGIHDRGSGPRAAQGDSQLAAT
jgi:hypothetical protein